MVGCYCLPSPRITVSSSLFQFPVLQDNLEVYLGLQQFVVTSGTGNNHPLTLCSSLPMTAKPLWTCCGVAFSMFSSSEPLWCLTAQQLNSSSRQKSHNMIYSSWHGSSLVLVLEMKMPEVLKQVCSTKYCSSFLRNKGSGSSEICLRGGCSLR